MPKARPKIARVSEVMKEWASLLETELASWPSVKARSMFGMTALYRGSVIFGVLPRTRSLETQQSVAFKLYRQTPRIRRMLEADPRIRGAGEPGVKWITFELQTENDLAIVLRWFDLAYRSCVSRARVNR